MAVIKEPTKGLGPFLNQRHMSPKFKKVKVYIGEKTPL
jgi:hypothetical protein